MQILSQKDSKKSTRCTSDLRIVPSAISVPSDCQVDDTEIVFSIPKQELNAELGQMLR